MGYLAKRINYVKGLMEGMNFDITTNEGKVIKALYDVVEDLVLSVEDLEDTEDQILEVVEEYGSRLNDLEDEVYDDCYDEDFDDPMTCPECGADLDFEELGIDDTIDSFKCPSCGTKIDVEWLDCDEVPEKE